MEYILQDAQPPHLFVIRKQWRSLAGVINSLAYYYILDGTVYQSPTLHAVLSARLVSPASGRPSHVFNVSFVAVAASVRVVLAD